MQPQFSMACLTALNLTPPQALTLAAKTGYARIGIRLLPAAPGGIDLAALFHRLPDDLPISLETPNDRRAPLVGAAAWAREVMAAGRGFSGGLQ